MLFKLLFPVGFIVSAFLFFKLIRDDIKLVSLRLSEELILDIFFLTSLGALVGARLLTYFSGPSFTGAVLGSVFFLYLVLKRKNILRLRIFDLAALSSLPVIVLGFLGNLYFLEAAVFFVLAVLLLKIYKNPLVFSQNFNFPGVFFLIFLLASSFLIFVLGFAKEERVLLKLLTVEQVITLVVFGISLYLLRRGFLGRGHL